MGQSRPCLYCLKKPANSWPGGCLSEADASAQVELDSGKRVKVKAANIAAEVREARARRAAARGAGAGRRASSWTWPGNSRPRRNSASPTWRATTSAPRPRWRSRRPRCCACSRRRTTSAAPARAASSKAPAEILQQALAAIEKKKQVQAQIDAWAARTGRRQLPGADARAAVQDPVQAGQERARIQGRGRGLARHAARAPLDLLQTRRRDRLALPVPLAALPVRELPQGHRLPAAAAPADQGRAAAGAGAGLLDRRLQHHRDRRRAVGAGPGHAARSRWASTSPRRAWPSQPAAPIDQVARQRLSTVYMPGYKITMLPDDVVQAYTLQEGRDCPAVSLYVQLRRSHAGGARHARRAWSACRSPPTCATTSSTPSSPKHGWKTPPPAPRPRRAVARFARRAVLPVPPGAAPEGAARGGARQAGELQPARLQLPPGRQRRRRARRATSRCRSACASRGAPLDLIVAEAMILANSTWGSWLARLRRARHLPQPGQPGARRQGAHGHQGRCRMRASA